MNILKYPDPRLRVKCKPLSEINDKIRQDANEMIELMLKAEGVGLAASQVGLDYRMIVIRQILENGERKVLAFINPEITKKEGVIHEEEGCLSFPGIYAKVTRAQKIEITAVNLEGEELKIEVSDYLSRVFQHEIDHLNGVLFADRLSPAQKIALSSKLKKMEKDFQDKNK